MHSDGTRGDSPSFSKMTTTSQIWRNILLILVLLIGPYMVLCPFLVDPALGGRIGITLVFLFTAIGHFVWGPPMAQMLPPWIPQRLPLVYFSGVLEFLAAAALLYPPFTRVTGLVLCAFLIAIYPVNVYAAYQRIPFGGQEIGPRFLLLRTPLQLILAAWVWWFAVR